MAKGREFYQQQAREEKPKAIRKRPAPKPRKPKVKRPDAKKATAWKLPPDTKPAIDMAAERYGVERGELVDFILRAGLQMLAIGKIELPVKPNEDAGPRNTIKPQAIPDEFSE